MELPTLGGDLSQATDVNDDTLVVGWSHTGILGMGTHAFSWTPSGGILDLTPNAFGSRAWGVSESGWIVGELRPNGGNDLRAVRWSPGGGQPELLGDLPGGNSKAFGVNAAGIAVGLSGDADFDSRAVLWDASGMPRDLLTLGGPGAEANDINDDDVVVGLSEDAAGNFRAFVWTEATGIQPLPTPYGGVSFPAGINNAGQIAGSITSPTGSLHAVLWQPNGSGYDVIDLETLGGATSQAFDIDESGRVVGRSSSNAPGGDRPFVWTPEEGIQEIEDVPGTAAGISGDGSLVSGWTPPNFSRATLWSLQEGAPTLELSASATLLHPRIRTVTVNGVLQPEVPSTVVTLQVSATNGGTPVPDIDVSLSGEVIPGSGHDHVIAPIALTSPNMASTQGGPDQGLPLAGHFLFDGQRRDEITAPTDMAGVLQAEFAAGHLGTRLWVIATANLAGETVADTVTLTIVVSDLVDLEQELAPSDPDIYWIGPTTEHSENWYVNQDLVIPLSFVASTMRSSLDGTLLYLQYNDASLPLGGAFSFAMPGESTMGSVFEDPFQRPHRSHANGLDIDIAWCYAMQRGNDGGANRVKGTNCLLPGGATADPRLRVNLLDLQDAAASEGGEALPHDGTHYHIRFRR